MNRYFSVIAVILIAFSSFWIGIAFEKWRTSDDVDAIRFGCEESYQKLFPETKDEDLVKECVNYILQGD